MATSKKTSITKWFQFLIVYLLIILIFPCSACCDDIMFKDGKILKNVNVLREEANWIIVQTSWGETKFNAGGIERIDKTDYNPQNSSTFINVKAEDIFIPPPQKPYEDGLYFGIGLPYLLIGGEFKGDIILASSEAVVFIPTVSNSQGLGFIVGYVFISQEKLAGGFEISYLKSNPSIKWGIDKGDASYRLINLDLFFNSRPFSIGKNSAHVFIKGGLNIPSLRLRNFAASLDDLENVEFRDASFTGFGYNMGVGLAYHFSRRLTLNGEILYRSIKYMSVKVGSLDRVSIAGEEGLKSGAFNFNLALTFTL